MGEEQCELEGVLSNETRKYVSGRKIEKVRRKEGERKENSFCSEKSKWLKSRAHEPASRVIA